MPQSNKSQTTPSGLLDELKACNDATLKHRLDDIIESLPTSEKESLIAVLAKIAAKNSVASTRSKHAYSYNWLAGVLTKHGHQITANQIRHYMVRVYKKSDGA